MIKAQKVYYCEYNHWTDENGRNYCRADITTNQNEAMELDKNFRLATIGQAIEFVGLGYEPIKIIEVVEGVYLWVEAIEYETVLGDEEYFVGYIYLQPSSEWEIRSLHRIICETR